MNLFNKKINLRHFTTVVCEKWTKWAFFTYNCSCASHNVKFNFHIMLKLTMLMDMPTSWHKK